MNRLALSVALAVVTAAGVLMAQAAPAAAGPIQVKQCFVVPPKALSSKPKGTQIDYINVTHKTATSVTFAVGDRNSMHNFVRRVTDVGESNPRPRCKRRAGRVRAPVGVS